jgi:hypothetical protein
MGFSGGGTNLLKAHKHTSAVQDGSPLNMDNVTEGSLTAGDVIYSDGAALQRLAIGAAADNLVVNAGATAPEWTAAAAGGATITTQKISPTGGQTTTSVSMTNVTNGSATLPTRAGGQAFMTYCQSMEKNTTGYVKLGFYYNGSSQERLSAAISTTGLETTASVSAVDDLDGGTIQLQWGCDGGTATLRNDSDRQSFCVMYEVS